MKNKETLEETALRLYPIILEDDGWDKNKQYRDEWIEGAKWQAERSYSEEEAEKIAKNAYEMGRKGMFIAVFSKWFEQFKKK
jgi:hypothetical protein